MSLSEERPRCSRALVAYVLADAGSEGSPGWTHARKSCSFGAVNEIGQPSSESIVTESVAANSRQASKSADGSLYRYVGREFTEVEMEIVRTLCLDPAYPTRASISRALCRSLGWTKPDGGLKDMSARVALAKMAADGLIILPAPTGPQPVPRRHLEATIEEGPMLACSLGELGSVSLVKVDTRSDSATWNELIGRFHYLGYTRASGAQLRYLAISNGRLLGAIGFGAAAWALQDRDTFIGWDAKTRRQRLHLIVGNPRYLILPWVRVPHLASHLLGAVARALPGHWVERYGYAPVLLETFVDVGRYAGTCYKAANWVRVGQTKGRGKLDRDKAYALGVKDIYCYPLSRNFRTKLLGEGNPAS